MKISNILLLVLLASVVVHFTKLNNYFPINGIIILGLGLFTFVLMFWEVHRENKKRHQLANEIRTGEY